jgi:chloramphenicol O-acetyltransferase type A
MRTIDLETWPRRDHFRLYRSLDYPHFSMCAPVDATAFYPAVKQRGASFTIATMYVLARAANALPAFRQRIRGDAVVEHEVVHPSVTMLTQDELFSFCTVAYADEFPAFAVRAADRLAALREQPTLADEPGQDDLLFMTAIPWVSFTNFSHPQHWHPVDAVPRFAWGKLFQDGGVLKMPLDVQGHHALMDGLHVGRFYAQVQDFLDHPEAVLGAA